MSGISVTRDTFRMMVTVPDDLVSLPAEGEWAAWLGITSTQVDGRTAVVLVSITVTALDAPRERRRRGREGRPRRSRRGSGPGTRKAPRSSRSSRTPGGNRAVGVRRTVTQRVNDRDVTTGQAQALVAYPGPGALGVVSGVALDPADLDRAAVLVTGIAAGMTVTSAPAAA